MSSIDLGGDYHARPISPSEYRELMTRLEDRVFGGNWDYRFDPPTKAPPPPGEEFAWGLFHGAEPVGWSYATQRGDRTVYMADTGLLPEHQGRGLYTRLLPHLLAAFRAAGYTLVQSHHRATNNRVIIPKLRAGFFIQGLDLYAHGLNAALTLSLDDTYRNAQQVRSGFRQPGAEAARRLEVRVLPTLSESEPTSQPALPEGTGPDFDLGGGYTLRPVDFAQAVGIMTALEGRAYDTVSFDWQDNAPFSPPQGERYAWLILHGEAVAGWQISRQWDSRTAYMVNTALLPEHRGRGVYSRLLPRVLGQLREAGYQLIRSHHHATNNAVLIPKLRAGFRLQGLEVDHHGVMAVLICPLNEVYAEYMDIRSGLQRPAGEAARRIGLAEEE